MGGELWSLRKVKNPAEEKSLENTQKAIELGGRKRRIPNETQRI